MHHGCGRVALWSGQIVCVIHVSDLVPCDGHQTLLVGHLGILRLHKLDIKNERLGWRAPQLGHVTVATKMSQQDVRIQFSRHSEQY